MMGVARGSASRASRNDACIFSSKPKAAAKKTAPMKKQASRLNGRFRQAANLKWEPQIRSLSYVFSHDSIRALS
jgi:hypothetical protein